MGEARSFKFGIWIDLGKSHLIHDKILPKGAWSGSRAQILNLPSSIYLEWVKLETLNLVRVQGPNFEFTLFHISGMGEARNVEFGT